MKQSITRDDFHRAFKSYNREDNFSRAGLDALFAYLEGYEESTGEEIELDVIALCCEYTECSITEALENYSLESLDELRDNTQVIEVDDETIIYQNY